MSRIKGGRASSKDVAVFTKKTKRGAAPAKKAIVGARRSMPMDTSGADEGAMDTMPERDIDMTVPTRKGRY